MGDSQKTTQTKEVEILSKFKESLKDSKYKLIKNYIN